MKSRRSRSQPTATLSACICSVPDLEATLIALCGSLNARLLSSRRLGRSDGEEAPLAGHALELMSATVVEFES